MNTRPAEWFGQTTELPEDRFAYDFLRLAERLPPDDEGFFIDIGAADGKTFSNTYAFARLGWVGIAVEPSPFVFPALLKNTAAFGDRVTCINAAIMPTGASAPLIPWYDSGGDLVSTADESHRQLWSKDVAFRKFFVKPANWADVLRVAIADFAAKRDSIARVDFVSIDVEGLNAETFDHCPLDVLTPTLVCVESEPTKPGNHERIVDRAKKSGYVFVRSIGCNLFFAREDTKARFDANFDPSILNPPATFDGSHQ